MHKYLALIILVPWSLVLVALWGLWRRFRKGSRSDLAPWSPGEKIASQSEAKRNSFVGLSHGDKLMKFSFMILNDYVENNREKVFAEAPKEIDPLFEDYWAGMVEVAELYNWWRLRPTARRGLDSADDTMREYLKQKYEEEDQLMLARLVNVRPRLV